MTLSSRLGTWQKLALALFVTFAPISLAYPQAPAIPELATLSQSYQAELARAQSDHDGKLARFNAQYIADVSRLQQELTKAGSLEGALATKAESDRFAQGREPSEGDKKAMPARLLALRNAYDKNRKPVADELDKRLVAIHRKQLSALDLLQRQLTQANQLEKALEIKAERDRVAALASAGEPVAGQMTAQAARRLFQLSEKDWAIAQGKLVGKVGEPKAPKSQAMGPATELRFGFKMKAKWYHWIEVHVDGERFMYSRGHWGNVETLFRHSGKEHRLPGKVTNPDEWAALEAVVKNGKIEFYYNGKMEAERPLKPMPAAGHIFNVGFNSYQSDVELKDCSLVLSGGKK